MINILYLIVTIHFQPITSESPVADDADKTRVQFDTSPIMSTYLLAFIVGEYDYVEDTDSDGVRVRVYTPQGKKEQGRFALEVRGSVWIVVYKLYSFLNIVQFMVVNKI